MPSRGSVGGDRRACVTHAGLSVLAVPTRLYLVGLIACGLAATTKVDGADEVQRWIRQLGADGFPERQAAHQHLLQQGPQVLPRLREAAGQGDPEVRARAAKLVDRLREAEFEALLQELLSTPSAAPPGRLPAYRRFAAITGDTRAARELYRDMLRSVPDLLLLLDRNDPRLTLEVQAFLQIFNPSPYQQQLPEEGLAFPTAQVASIVLLAVEYEPLDQAVIATRLRDWLSTSGVAEFYAGDDDSPWRQLLSAWVQSTHTGTRSQRMLLARDMGLPAGVLPARETLADERSSLADKQDALLLIARFGGVENVPDLEPLLRDATELSGHTHRTQVVRQTKLQDLALIGLIELTDQDPNDYKFTPLQENSQTVYAAQSIGFESEEARDKALARWRRWRVTGLAKPDFPPLEAVEGVEL
jgi:hypothetical protein